jgi:hypothetical protein
MSRAVLTDIGGWLLRRGEEGGLAACYHGRLHGWPAGPGAHLTAGMTMCICIDVRSGVIAAKLRRVIYYSRRRQGNLKRLGG